MFCVSSPPHLFELHSVSCPNNWCPPPGRTSTRGPQAGARGHRRGPGGRPHRATQTHTRSSVDLLMNCREQHPEWTMLIFCGRTFMSIVMVQETAEPFRDGLMHCQGHHPLPKWFPDTHNTNTYKYIQYIKHKHITYPIMITCLAC